MPERMFLRPNGEYVTKEQVFKLIAQYIASDPHSEYEITVGTDSQSGHKTKMVEVIVARRMGSGGIFFYRTSYVDRINNLRQKIQEETQRSLALADSLLEAIECQLIDIGMNLNNLSINFKIHCDVGQEGETNALIKEIVGWVHSMGYECCIKPTSYAASTIANKYSK